jgi:16S rRNA (cytidine1402-2'-O)-methyltransferase
MAAFTSPVADRKGVAKLPSTRFRGWPVAVELVAPSAREATVASFDTFHVMHARADARLPSDDGEGLEHVRERGRLARARAAQRRGAARGDQQQLLAAAFGARQAAICRELTKTYEEVIRGDLVELAQSVTELRGEITLVVEGRTTPQLASADPTALADEVARRVEAGADRKEALTEVAAEAGVSRRDVYDAVVAAKRAP